MTGTTYADLFDAAGLEAALQRIASLTPASQPLWGKMGVAAMFISSRNSRGSPAPGGL